MSNRFPPVLVVPISLLAAVGATWVVGAIQAKTSGLAPTPILDAVPSPGATDNSTTADASTLPPGESAEDAMPSSVDDSKMHPEFPTFSGTTATGAKFNLSDCKGKVVLVNFWATWCPPCRMEIPDLIALQAKYASRGFTVVGLSEDDNFSQAIMFAKSAKMNYPVLKTPEGLAATLGITGLPTSVLVGKDGKVITAMSGVDPKTGMQVFWSPKIEKVL
jgi:thiol-disulfide isomerase/thioredoxin